MNTSANDTTDQQLAELKGQRLAALLALSSLPDEQKEAWAALVPQMTPEQVDQFISLLLSERVAMITEQTLAEFTQAVEDTNEQYDQQALAATKDSLSQLEDLGADIEALEKQA